MNESKYLFEYIPTEISDTIMSYVGDIEFVVMSHVCQVWKIIIKSFRVCFTKKREFIYRVARLGYLNIIQWARENGCGWDSLTCSGAAQGGHLEVLKWARENGCEWDSCTCFHAAKGGHLEILKWTRENGCNWNYLTCSYAAYGVI
jgi:hypothetical protein